MLYSGQLEIRLSVQMKHFTQLQYTTWGCAWRRIILT